MYKKKLKHQRLNDIKFWINTETFFTVCVEVLCIIDFVIKKHYPIFGGPC
jgi:hypothetical protein